MHALIKFPVTYQANTFFLSLHVPSALLRLPSSPKGKYIEMVKDKVPNNNNLGAGGNHTAKGKLGSQRGANPFVDMTVDKRYLTLTGAVARQMEVNFHTGASLCAT
jgi:hypothetical protein